MFNKAFVSTLLLVPFMARFAFAGPCVRTYTIQEGDICDSISAEQHVSTYQLAVINLGVIDDLCHNLTPNDEICIGYEGEDCEDTYVVKSGDTCNAITASHSIDMETLYTNNGQINDACDNIYIGEVLCVADHVVVPPVPEGYDAPSQEVPADAIPAQAPPPPPPAPEPEYIVDDTDPSLPFCDEL